MLQHILVTGKKQIPARLLIVLMEISIVTFLSGCTQADFNSSDLYKNIEQQTQNFAQTTVSDGIWWQRLTQKIFEVSNMLKAVAPIIILASIGIGSIILILITKEQKLRQKAILIFIIGIPLITVIVTYGLAFLAGMFL